MASAAFPGLLTVVMTVAPAPAGELDGGVPDGAGAPGDQHGAAGHREGAEPGGTALGHRQGPVRGDRGYAEGGPHVVRDPLGQREGVRGRHDRVFGGGAEGTAVRREHDPHPVAGVQRQHARSDRVHHAGAVHVRRDLGEAGVAGRAPLPVPSG
ncbi:hypothetical protein GCM10020358_61500 [Amorphoplanes nipponensis]